jgi:uncharacterized SAM-binding protein YcdF (DUF218 family)
VLYEVGKVLQIFLRPFILGLAVAALALLCLHLKRYVAARRLLYLFLGLNLVFSVPFFPLSLGQRLERMYASRPSKEYPTAGAIVVLGGTTAAVRWPRQESEELGGSRLMPAARLFKAGKAPLVIVTGGETYTGTRGDKRSQTGDMKELLMEMGVPADAIVEEIGSRNTHEDVQFAADLLEKRGIKSALLVTTAWHMFRAMAFAERTGVHFTPVPIGHEIVEEPYNVWSFFPDPGALSWSATVLKEYIGFVAIPWYNRHRGVASEPKK